MSTINTMEEAIVQRGDTREAGTAGARTMEADSVRVANGAIARCDVRIRVRYNETDRMGIVHHSNYIFYYEVARTELMRSLGTSYREMEDRGALLVIRDVKSHFISPAYYDEILTVKVSVPEMPTVKLIFHYDIFNDGGELIHTGETLLACVDGVTRRPKRVPEWFVELLTANGQGDV